MKHFIRFFWLALLVIGLGPFRMMAQTNISGVINDYTAVTAISTSNCTTQVSVASTSGLAVGDRVLIIQMKGAAIDSSNTASFGTVLNFNGAGNYEFNEIASVSGNSVTLTSALCKTYEVSGKVQLIRVPVYSSATVTSGIQAQPWNGSTGGVVVLEVTNTLTLNASIDVSGQGFRGGTTSLNPNGGCGSGSSGYFYDPFVPNQQVYGAEKGEGIAIVSTAKQGGRGPLANGGGGGNKHNHGGGGGGNYSAGGEGGNSLQGCNTQFGGIGGNGLAAGLTNSKLFLGGGGGCGDDNNSVGTVGTNGGGIVIIVANQLVGNNQTLDASGLDQTQNGLGIADGAGGGGAGGSVLLKVNQFTGTLNVVASGGDGGNQLATWGCVGPGGGGGRGVVIRCDNPLPQNVNVTMVPGAAGMFLTTGMSCTGSPYGASAGSNTPSTPLQQTPCWLCPLPGTGATLGLIEDSTLCAGTSLLLDATFGSASHVWQDGSTNPTFTVTTTGIYWVDVIVGCDTVRDSATITFANIPPPALGPDTTLCPGDSLVLTAGSSGGGLQYAWSNASTGNTLTVSQPGTYSVTVSSGGCVEQDTITISYFTGFSVNLGPDTTICSNQTYTLDVTTPGASYLWHDGSSNPTFPVTQGGVVAVTVTVGSCTLSDTVNISYQTIPLVNLGNDTTLCSGDSLSVFAPATTGTTTWSTGSPSSTLNVTGPGTYWLAIQQGICVSSDTINVAFLTGAGVALGNDTALCPGVSYVLNPMTPGASYLWQDGSTQSTFAVTQAGTYWVNVDNGNCSASDTVIVSYHNLPVIDLGNDTVLCSGDSLTLSVPVSGGGLTWSTGATDSAITIGQSGTFHLTYQQSGCILTDTVEVVVLNPIPVSLGSDTSLCEEDFYSIHYAIPGASYLWHDGTTGPSYTVSGTATYSVTITLGNCTVSDTLQSITIPSPLIDLGPDTTLCGSSFILSPAPVSGTYLWSDGSTGSSLAVNTSGIYWLAVENLGCTGYDTAEVTLLPPLVFDLGNDTALCEGESLVVELPNSPAGYIWQDGSGGATYAISAPGAYWYNPFPTVVFRAIPLK